MEIIIYCKCSIKHLSFGYYTAGNQVVTGYRISAGDFVTILDLFFVFAGLGLPVKYLFDYINKGNKTAVKSLCPSHLVF